MCVECGRPTLQTADWVVSHPVDQGAGLTEPTGFAR